MTMYDDQFFSNILENGTTIKSSGTSGQSKEFFQSPQKLLAASKVAQEVQQLTDKSRIYTCCKLTHAGGLLAQTLPGWLAKSSIVIEPFSAFEFVKKINNFTHSHITPLHAKAIMLTKGFRDLDLSGVTIMCGADPVTWDIIEAFVQRGARLITNWGMSEIGPVAINYTFTDLDQVKEIKSKSPSNTTIMGNNVYCDYLVSPSGSLIVKGDISIFDDWYDTKDIVAFENGIFYYKGRAGMDIDLNAPKKG